MGEVLIEHSGSPLLVLGGPGTGKTTFLEKRFLHLASETKMDPHRILLLCGNRLYATGARERLARLLPQEAMVEVPVYTWHALAYHLVTRNYSKLGFKELPVLLTAAEQWGTVRELLDLEQSSDWPVWGSRLGERAFADEVADFCLRVEQQLMGPEQLQSLIEVKPDWAEVIRFAGRYRAHLLARSRLDYAQLIAGAGRLLGDHPDLAATLKDRFPHVMVDDGQDLGPAHLELLQKLETKNLVVAADPDCGIEGFRGAQPDWVFGFEKLLGPFATMTLEKSRRIGAPLAPALLRLIEHNDSSSEHRPIVNPDLTTRFDCRQYSSTVEEVESIARELKRSHVVDGLAWTEMAILVSQPRYLLGPLQRALELCGVPFQPMQGNRPLASEPAVRWFLDLVRVALGAEEGSRLLPDLLTSPLIGMDFPDRRRLERDAWRTGRSLTDICATVAEAEELRKLSALVKEHRDRADECFWQVYSNASHYRWLEAEACSDARNPANTAIDALVDFSHTLERFVERRRGAGSIDDYLSEAARADFGADPWLPSSSRSAPGVALSTFHGAKGAEWELVVVAGCLDAWIPKGKRAQGLFDPLALQVPDISTRAVEAVAEDRRTFYVAASRARSKVIFTVAPPNGARTKPSRFLIELAGEAPALAGLTELPPLNLSELSARLRRTLASDEYTAAEKVAAVVALSEIPGTDPDLWYGRRGWTPGATPLVTEELRTSYSRLSVFENCGLQYVLQSVLGLDPSSTYSMKFGTWIHSLFQAYHQEAIPDAEGLRAEYEKLFDSTIFPNSTIARQFHRDGLRMLEVFWDNEAATKNVIAERTFEFAHSGATLRGRIDRIDKKGGNALILTDYKTAKWAPSYVEAQSSLQLAIYHLAAKMDPELSQMGEPQLARLVYPGAYRSDGSYQVLTQNAEQAEKVIERLPEIIAGVRGEDFKPSPLADCHFCKMKPLCPLYPDGQELET
jgi:superfamily I DNA/RNA helicase/RecB family exonuclease